MTLGVNPGLFAICRLDAGQGVPSWASSQPFSAQVLAGGSLSIVTPEEVVPETVEVERGWRLLVLQGPFPFSAVGVLSSVLVSLAEAGVSILAFSGFDTDYVLVKDNRLPRAVVALERAGHKVLT